MVGYLIAAPTLMAAVPWKLATASAGIPSPQATDAYDLNDLLTEAALPTMALIAVTVNADGTASFDLPRAEVGQGITTAIAMTIADELELPLERVAIRLSDARPELGANQFTAVSNTMHALYEPVRLAAAIARVRLIEVAAEAWGVAAMDVRAREGVITGPGGRRATYGSLAEKAAVSTTTLVRPRLKRRSRQRIVGTEQRRIDALDIVTGRKQFAMDLQVPDALPTMVCRPPTINGRALWVRNLADVQAMPGVTDVALIAHDEDVQGGVAVRAKTFGQCIDAVRALDVVWGPGSVEGQSDESVLAEIEAAEIPLTPALPGETIEKVFTFHFRPGSPLETNCAIADVRSDHAEIWSSLKSPIWAHERVAQKLGLGFDKVNVHVTEGGGSFGRHLFCDAAFEAAIISKALGKPVKLMWHRTDDFRHGRVHPMCISRVRVTRSGGNVIAYDQRHTGVATDFTCGFGEILGSMLAKPPQFNLGYSRTLFHLTSNVPYAFGAVTQLLNEIHEYNTFNTSPVRHVFSPDVATARELMVDQLAAAMGKDPYAFRREFAKDDRARAVLDKVAEAGQWGRPMQPGTGQGIIVHSEYKGRAACLVEIDCRPETVNREIHDGYGGPRVTKVVFAVDVGLPINPLGIKAQMTGGIMDGLGQALSYGLHLEDGHFLEGSWHDAFYTRQWNTPHELEVIVMPPTTSVPGGVGEFGCGPTMAAVACAYGRATGTMPTSFPLNHHGPLRFEPYPTTPPIPPSPTDGLEGIR